MSKPKKNISVEHPNALFGRVVSILEQAQGNVVRAVNTNMVLAYWLIGREIVQELQGGEERAAYGKKGCRIFRRLWISGEITPNGRRIRYEATSPLNGKRARNLSPTGRELPSYNAISEGEQ